MSGNGGIAHEVDTRSRLPSVIAGMEKTLERELGRAPPLAPEQPMRNVTRSPLQSIAHEIKRLTYDDAITLGKGLANEWEKIKETNNELEQTFAAIIQRWASGRVAEEA